VDPIYFQTYQYYQARQKEVSDPTTLIVVDEADRLRSSSHQYFALAAFGALWRTQGRVVARRSSK
jgi:hypothetical protein